MAIEQDFLPYAVGGSANVLSQSAYAALTSLLQNGLTSGIVPSNQLNKTMRQSSVMAAVLAQFIVDNSGQPAIDDGTTATLLANLIAAVSATSPVVVGSVRNLAMSVTAASATATLTADEIIVESALGGLTYKLANFSKTINLGTTGAGGMDTGTAPASGFVALYAIYNPTTGASALLATNATAAAQPNVYGSANMPSGYAASALVGVWPTTSGSLFIANSYQLDRRFYMPQQTALSTTTQQTTPTALSVATWIPKNARTVSGAIAGQTSVSSSCGTSVFGNSAGSGLAQVALTTTGASSINSWYSDIPLITQQTIYYTGNAASGTYTTTISVNGYTF